MKGGCGIIRIEMRKAFTLVEMLIVVVVLVTLMAITFRLGAINSSSDNRRLSPLTCFRSWAFTASSVDARTTEATSIRFILIFNIFINS